MTLDRLNGLATLQTQRDIKLDLNGMINIYSRKHNRQLRLNNVLCSDEEMMHDDEAITSEVN